MESFLPGWSLLVLPGLVLWFIILLLPWRPWSTRETLDADPECHHDLGDITVLIPARNEAAVIATTLQALAGQDRQLQVVLVDDQSTDATADIARQQNLPRLHIINGEPLADGWSGKLWALEQGLQHVSTPLVLLLDADIKLLPGTLATLRHKLDVEDLALLSLMAKLRMQTGWEKLLLPAFIFFFKLLYPFHLSNSGSRLVAAAAGGCILVRKNQLQKVNAFASLRGSLIDDCALARKIRETGGRTWIGLTHSAVSLRPYHQLSEIRDMVARTAFTQLRYSWLLLLVCTALMVVAFILPLLSLLQPVFWSQAMALLTLAGMACCYRPVLKYYGISTPWLLSLPVAGAFYLGMTWISACRHVLKSGARWRGRSYSIPQSH